MYEPETTPKLLAIRLSGKLGRADYECLYLSLREQLAESPSRPSILVAMDSAGTLIEGIELDIAHHDDVSRVGTSAISGVRSSWRAARCR